MKKINLIISSLAVLLSQSTSKAVTAMKGKNSELNAPKNISSEKSSLMKDLSRAGLVREVNTLESSRTGGACRAGKL